MRILLWVLPAIVFRPAWGASRIVGGAPVSIKTYPYQLSLQLKRVHRCGAAILSPTVAVTAAHCLLIQGTYSVRAGSTFCDRGGLEAFVQNGLIHPSYSSDSNDYDIALLFLTEPLQYSDSIKPVKLPSGDGRAVRQGMVGKVTGWGYIYSNIPMISEQLRAVELPVLDRRRCERSYRYGMFTENMFCAGLPQGGKDSCQGDSGGPFVVDGVLYGIISFGLDCAQPGFPGVYTSVPRLRSFIQEYGNL